jgi:4-phosphopantoate--beta-alanine ligase
MTIHEDHPRRDSLLSRQKMVDAQNKGLLADSALIAHGRGEAFDYLLGECTIPSARRAEEESVNRLAAARCPVISLNGNSTVLAGRDAMKLAALVGCKIEINIFYRTDSRVNLLYQTLNLIKNDVASENPSGEITSEIWSQMVANIEILGTSPDAQIPGLEGPRAKCCSQGIHAADTVLVPLEDGDRCEALIKMGKQVLVVDLNPLSRTARTANVTIVDNVSRAFNEMVKIGLEKPASPDITWDNRTALIDAIETMGKAAARSFDRDD